MNISDTHILVISMLKSQRQNLFHSWLEEFFDYRRDSFRYIRNLLYVLGILQESWWLLAFNRVNTVCEIHLQDIKFKQTFYAVEQLVYQCSVLSCFYCLSVAYFNHANLKSVLIATWEACVTS